MLDVSAENSNLTDFDWARQIAQSLLRIQERPTTETIQRCVSMAVQNIQVMGRKGDVNEEQLVRELETLYNTWCGLGSVLEDITEHVPWLADRKPDVEWHFWNRFEKYLEQEEMWAPESRKRLDQMTDWIMERIENPLRESRWSRRGMVVGQVQSGKTSNYTALVCKAADAGYKLIIVLAGLHDSLRVQTQSRLDEGFLGTQIHKAFAEDNLKPIGVGKIPIKKRLFAYSGTSSAPKGDFNRTVAKQYTTIPGGNHPVLLVVKKNKSVLTNILKWALALADSYVDSSGQRRVRNVPLLIIDDECDNASVNTNPIPRDEQGKMIEDHDPSVINGLIRKLLDVFEQNAYVGYTATPFANIFIHPESRSTESGDDLFPRSFIINLASPSNYIGPAKVFGVARDELTGLEAQEGLKELLKPIQDYQAWMPDGHKKEWTPPDMADSLKKAIKSFILVIAARHYRGQEKKHNSMLVHVTRFTAVQRLVKHQVEEELEAIKLRLRYREGHLNKGIYEELRELWETDFMPASASIEGPESVIQFSEIEPLLSTVTSKIKVKEINGQAKDVLDYFERNNALSVIAIGGDKLSRGLTLEGLSVSYYLRASKMYDTLMQMGRWFGYRPGYLDLCRLYTSDELIESYGYITAASEELRADFDAMADAGGTPLNFGLRVRTNPYGLIVSALNKIQSGIPMKVTYAGNISETVVFESTSETIKRNYDAAASFVSSLAAKHAESRKNDTFIWSGVSGDEILDFLNSFATADVKKVRVNLICKYIAERVQNGRLTNWTVALISGDKENPKHEIAKHEIFLVKRRTLTQDQDRFTIRRLLSPTDEYIDLSKEQIEKLQQEAVRYAEEKGNKTPVIKGPWVRTERGAKNGLLLLYPLIPPVPDAKPVIGFGISFPTDPSAPVFDYLVNNPFWDQEFGDE